MTSVLPAIHPAPLHYRALQCLRLEALGQKRSPDYDSSVKLSSEAVKDLQWWIHSLRHHNGRPIYSPEPTLVLESDASKKGWGAHCRENGISTGGPWTREESQAHINWLELKAAFLATQTFVKHPCHVQIFSTTKWQLCTQIRWGDTLSAAVQAGGRVLGLVHETSDHNSCGAPARQIECARRLRVPPPIRLQRLETESRDLFTTECPVRSFYDRPACLTLEQASELFFQLEARSAGIGSGCSGSLMG